MIITHTPHKSDVEEEEGKEQEEELSPKIQVRVPKGLYGLFSLSSLSFQL